MKEIIDPINSVDDGILVVLLSGLNADAYSVRVVRDKKIIVKEDYYYGYQIKSGDISVVFDAISRLTEKHNLPVYNASQYMYSVFAGKWMLKGERLNIPESIRVE
jgi:hypothetical protein